MSRESEVEGREDRSGTQSVPGVRAGLSAVPYTEIKVELWSKDLLARRVDYGLPERYFDRDAQAFRYRIKRFETWYENDQKMGLWEWEPWTGQVPCA